MFEGMFFLVQSNNLGQKSVMVNIIFWEIRQLNKASLL